MICKNCGIDTNLLSRVLDKAEREQARIAELEAEVERLRAFCNEWIYNEESFQEQSAVKVCPLTTEEGEG